VSSSVKTTLGYRDSNTFALAVEAAVRSMLA